MLPLTGMYRTGVRLRNLAYDHRLLKAAAAPIPVISVGNLTVGGTGKTPFTGWLIDRLSASGRSASVLMRGYGMDEAALHAARHPGIQVIVGPDRRAGAVNAAISGADCAILDDGYQHRALGRDLNLLLVSTEQAMTGYEMLPLGPWREPMESVVRADVVLVTRKTAVRTDAERIATHLAKTGQPTGIIFLGIAGFRSLKEAHLIDKEKIRDRDVLAVTTLAEPDSFYRQLEQLGGRVERVTFPDHHVFSASDIAHIESAVQDKVLVVTEKEAVKLHGQLKAEAWIAVQGLEVERGLEEIDSRLDHLFDRN